jgi:hypothetical protein
MKDFDLTTKKGQGAAFMHLHKTALMELREFIPELAPGATLDIIHAYIGIGVSGAKGYREPHGDISLFPETEQKDNRIMLSSCGAFTPEVKGAYWRAIHAAAFLKNWKKTSEWVNKWCSLWEDLYDKVQNELK